MFENYLKYRKKLNVYLIEAILIYSTIFTIIFWNIDMTTLFKIHFLMSSLFFGWYMASILSIRDFGDGYVYVDGGRLLGLYLLYHFLLILIFWLLNFTILYETLIAIAPILIVLLVLKMIVDALGSEPI